MKGNINLYLIAGCFTVVLAILFFILFMKTEERTIYAELISLAIGVAVFNFSIYNKLKREKELNLND